MVFNFCGFFWTLKFGENEAILTNILKIGLKPSFLWENEDKSFIINLSWFTDTLVSGPIGEVLTMLDHISGGVSTR